MMWAPGPAPVFLYHVVEDLTVGKPELSEFLDTETVASAIRTIADYSPGGVNIIPVWEKHKEESENEETLRFVGILSALDIAVFLAREDNLGDEEKAMSTAVSEVVLPNRAALKLVDPATRLIDALEMMKQGVELLLVPKSSFWGGTAKRFSILCNGKWHRNTNTNMNPPAGNNAPSSALHNANMGPSIDNTSCALHNPNQPSTSSMQNKFCCLCREDVLRFLIGCLGALAPLPLTSIASLGAINPNYSFIDATYPAIQALKDHPCDPLAVVVVETTPNCHHKIIGEISSTKLWRCDYLAVAWALANLSSGQFVTGVEDYVASRLRLKDVANIAPKENPPAAEASLANGSEGRGRSAPLTCRPTSSLAAVMAQMLSHRATHVWVTDEKEEDMVVGMVGYGDILSAVTRQSCLLVLDPGIYPWPW